MRYELKSVLLKPVIGFTFVALILLQVLLIPVYSRRLEAENETLALSLERIDALYSGYNHYREFLQASLDGSMPVPEEARAFGISIEDYVALYDHFIENTRMAVQAVRRELHDLRSDAFQKAYTRWHYLTWKTATEYDSRYPYSDDPLDRGPSDSLPPEERLALEAAFDLLDTKDLRLFGMVRNDELTVSARLVRHDALYQLHLYERGIVRARAGFLNGFVFGLELSTLVYVLAYVLLAAGLTVLLLQHFSGNRLARQYIPLRQRHGYFDRRFLLALLLSCLVLFGAELIMTLIRVVADPGIGLNYPVQMIRLNARIDFSRPPLGELMFDLLPIQLTAPADIAKLTTMPLGAVLGLNLLYRFILLAGTVALVMLLEILARLKRVRPILLFALTVLLAVVAVKFLKPAEPLYRLLDPAALLQGKGPVTYITAMLLISSIAMLLFFCGRRLSGREKNAASLE